MSPSSIRVHPPSLPPQLPIHPPDAINERDPPPRRQTHPPILILLRFMRSRLFLVRSGESYHALIVQTTPLDGLKMEISGQTPIKLGPRTGNGVAWRSQFIDTTKKKNCEVGLDRFFNHLYFLDYCISWAFILLIMDIRRWRVDSRMKRLPRQKG